MGKKYVKLVGRISEETYEKIKAGELVFNNGLRKTKGPASFYSEQPELWVQNSYADLGLQAVAYIIQIGLPIALNKGLPILFDRIVENFVKEPVNNQMMDNTISDYCLEQMAEGFPNNRKIIRLSDYRDASNL